MSKSNSEKDTAVDTKKTDTSVGIQPASSRQNSTKSKNDTPEKTEIGGRKGPEPTRYGDWEKNGRCIDF